MSIRSSATISLVPETRGGPFLFRDDLEDGCRRAGRLGFDAVEIFPSSAEAIDADRLRRSLVENGLTLSAVGTGAGWVLRRLTLTDADARRRGEAEQFVRALIDLAGTFGAPAIVGSMQGRWGDGLGRDEARAYLTEALDRLGAHAERHGAPLLFEPLNRYETNLVNTVAEGLQVVEALAKRSVRLLADLFHMNIEEAELPAAIRAGVGHIGHVHFVDSNRRPAGLGHIDYPPIVAALREIGYDGYVSAEALPYPDPDAAARQTLAVFRQLFRSETSGSDRRPKTNTQGDRPACSSTG